MRVCSSASVCVLLLILGASPGLAVAQEGIAPGEVLPSVGETLRQMDGTRVSPRSLGGREGTVFLFWSHRCPWVEKYQGRVDSLASRYRDQGIRFVLVNASDVEEAPEVGRGQAEGEGAPLSYVRDPSAGLARVVGAIRTPHAFVFGADWNLRYRGAIDDSPSLPGRVERSYLREVVEALIADEPVPYRSRMSFGCTLNVSDESTP